MKDTTFLCPDCGWVRPRHNNIFGNDCYWSVSERDDGGKGNSVNEPCGYMGHCWLVRGHEGSHTERPADESERDMEKGCGEE